MNGTQVQTTSSTLVAGLAGYAAAKGWLGLDSATWSALLVAVIAAWPAIVTRLQSLKNTVGNSGAKVITSAASADALPNNSNVIAASPAVTAVVGSAK